jgi:VWFA-related protein
LQQFTKDHDALIKAIEQATQGVSAPRLTSESDAIMAQLETAHEHSARQHHGAVLPQNTLAAGSQLAGTTLNGNGPPTGDVLAAPLARVMLDMMRMDAAAQSNGTRMSIDALKALVDGLRPMPGRKSVMYFSAGMYRGPELDNMWRILLATANRDNVTFYSVDTRGVMIGAQNTGAMNQLNGANQPAPTPRTRT